MRRELSEDYYRALFEQNPGPIYLFHPETLRFLDVNEAAIRKYGYSREEFLQKTILDIRPPEEKERFRAFIETLLASRENGPRQIGTWQHFRKDGQALLVEITFTRVNVRGEKVCCMALLDVTERVRMEEERETARQRLAQASRLAALGEMAGGIAHEINNPVAIIYASAEMLRDQLAQDPIDREELARIAERIQNTGGRIGRIVKALRALSRDGELDEMQDASLQTIVAEPLELCREKFRYHGIELQVSGVDSEKRLRCRPTEIAQVLVNLLSNSFDAVREREQRWVRLEVRSSDRLTEISITDSGPGIDPGLRDHILKPFFTTKEAGKGTGLGLSISRSIVERHGGSFVLDTGCENTRFVIRLPHSPAEAPLNHAA